MPWAIVELPAKRNPTLAGFAVKQDPIRNMSLVNGFGCEEHFWEQFVQCWPVSYASARGAAARSVALRDKVYSSLLRGPLRSEQEQVASQVTTMDVMPWWLEVDRQFLLYATFHDKFLYPLLDEGHRTDAGVAVAALAGGGATVDIIPASVDKTSAEFWTAVLTLNAESIKRMDVDFQRNGGESVLRVALRRFPEAMQYWAPDVPVTWGLLLYCLKLARRSGQHPMSVISHRQLCARPKATRALSVRSKQWRFWRRFWIDASNADGAREMVEVLMPNHMRSILRGLRRPRGWRLLKKRPGVRTRLPWPQVASLQRKCKSTHLIQLDLFETQLFMDLRYIEVLGIQEDDERACSSCLALL
jgi:hypothetical protein